LNYYRSKRYDEQPDIAPSNIIGELDKYSNEYNPNELKYIPTKSGKVVQMPLAKNYYRKDINDNQFMQRELANGILDTRAPMALYDRRIQPTKSYRFRNNDVNDPMYGDVVNLYGYDPAIIKPGSTKSVKTTTPVKPPIPVESDLHPVDIQGPMSFRSGVQPNPYRTANTSNVSKFSATYRNPSSPGGQQTIYFPDKAAWQGFLNTGALTGVDTAERDGQASATGYRAFAAGGDIHINPANKGKFTASANHAGMGVQEYASHVLNDPNASPLQKKRANFARNAAKWNHAMGGKLIKPFC